MVEILLKLALNTNQSINQARFKYLGKQSVLYTV